jgi:hypothetical protein
MNQMLLMVSVVFTNRQWQRCNIAGSHCGGSEDLCFLELYRLSDDDGASTYKEDLISFTLTMGAAGSSERLVNFLQTARCHIAEERYLQLYWCMTSVPANMNKSVTYLQHSLSVIRIYCGPGSSTRTNVPVYESISKIFRTDAVKIIKIINKRMWKLPMSTQPRASWHTDSLDMVVLPSTGASRYHNYCIDGGNSPGYFGYPLVLWFILRGCH